MKHGTIKIKLQELIDDSGMSKNKLSQNAQINHRQMRDYCNNNITRLDVDVLARICEVFGCTISDLLEYVPPKK